MATCQECGLPIQASELPVKVRPVESRRGPSRSRSSGTRRETIHLVHERCVHDVARRGFRALD